MSLADNPAAVEERWRQTAFRRTIDVPTPNPDEEIQRDLEEQARQEQYEEERQEEDYRRLEEEEYYRELQEAGLA